MERRPGAEPAQPGLVLALGRAGAGLLPDIGGKAANLGELMRAGLPVPAGFCLTTQAYRRVTSHPELDAVHAALAATPPDDLAELARLAADARRRSLARRSRPDIADAVRAASRAATDMPVAVRSSATAETCRSRVSPASRRPSLNVRRRPTAVLAAVRRCSAPLWTDRAVAYRATPRIPPSRHSHLAVVVQEMVRRGWPGPFTADPVTGRRHKTVIDASPGLREAVVSGAVNPDHFVVDSATQVLFFSAGSGTKIVGIRPGIQRRRVQVQAPGAGSIPAWTMPSSRPWSASDAARNSVGAPQDLEGAIDSGGALWLTQSRPFATLLPVARSGSRGEEHVRLLVLQPRPGPAGPLTPMGSPGSG